MASTPVENYLEEGISIATKVATVDPETNVEELKATRKEKAFEGSNIKEQVVIFGCRNRENATINSTVPLSRSVLGRIFPPATRPQQKTLSA